MDRYLTAEDVAERLQVDVSWVYRHKAQLGAVRLGMRLWRFSERELESYLAGRAVDSGASTHRPYPRPNPHPSATGHRWRVS
jgi:excisionase family DNA binding protein